MRRMKYQGNDKASGSRTHDKDELQVLCYNCRKPGHFKAECSYPIVKKHQDEHNYKKNSGRYHHPKSNPNDADEDSSSESDSSEDEKGLLCLFSQEDSDEEMCLMAEEEEVTSQNQSFNYSSESVCHENPREAFEKMMKSFYGIEDSHLKLKEENAKLLAERQDLEDLKSKNAEMLESISQLEKQQRQSTTSGEPRVTAISSPFSFSRDAATASVSGGASRRRRRYVAAAGVNSSVFPSPFLAEQMAAASTLLSSTVASERTKQSEARNGGAVWSSGQLRRISPFRWAVAEHVSGSPPSIGFFRRARAQKWRAAATALLLPSA
nr:uncharacterized protein LOC109169386 [Ipomoea trifida]